MDTVTTSRDSTTGAYPNSFDIAASGLVSPSQVVIDGDGDLGGAYTDATGLHVFTQANGAAAPTAVLAATRLTYFKLVGIDANGAVYGTYEVTDPATQVNITYSFKDSGGTLTILAGPRGAANTEVTSVNASGVAVGTYTDGSGNPQAFFLSGGTAAAIAVPAGNGNPASASIRGTTSIDALGGVAGAYQGTDGNYYVFLANASNAQQATSLKVPGQANSNNLSIYAVRGSAVTVRYGNSAVYATTAGELQTIAAPAGGSYVRPLGFDGAGNVVGLYSINKADQSFVYDPATGASVPFVYAGATPAGTTVSATAITGTDQAGDVFGTYTDSSGAKHGFVEQGGAFKTVPAPAGTTLATPNGIDAAGDVVGTFSYTNFDLSTSSGYGYNNSFVDRGGVTVPLTVPGQPIPRTGGLYVDALGQIVGTVSDGSVVHAFAAAPGSASTFDGRPDAIETEPVGSDATGEVAGNSFDANGVEHGFLRRADGTVTPFDASPTATATSVYGIDAVGEIVGNDTDGGQEHAYLRAADGTITRLDPAGDTSGRLDYSDASGNAAGVYQTVANGTTTDAGIFRRVNGTVTTTSLAGLGATSIESASLDVNGGTYGLYRVDDASGSHLHAYDVPANGAAVRIDPAGSKSVGNVVANRAGTVAGTYYDAGQVKHGFVYANGQTTLVEVPAGSAPTPIGDVSIAGIDAAGDVAGTYVYNGGKSANVYVRTAGGTFSTLALPGDAVAGGTPTVSAITSSGIVVGQYKGKDTQNHLFVVPSGGTAATRLDPLGSIASSFPFNEFNLKNDATGPANGVIAANFTDAGGVAHGLVYLDGQVSVVDGSATATQTGISSVDGQGDITGYYRDAAGFHVFESLVGRTPTIAGTHASGTTGEAALALFSGVTIGDGNAGATETLTITLSGPGGTLSDGAGYTGLKRNADGSYVLTGTAAAVTGELDALSFEPAAAGSTTFALTDVSSVGGVFTDTATDSATVVTDTAAPPSPPPPPPPPPPTPDTVSISQQVIYEDGVFTLTGTASSQAGGGSVEISALVGGARTVLGTAPVDANGTFTFQDVAGGRQTFFVATLTDSADGKATSSDPGFNLTGGLGPQGRYGAQESFDATEMVSRSIYRPDGQRFLDVEVPGQTIDLRPGDLVANHRLGNNTFVFSSTDGSDVIGGFRTWGANHDTLELPSSDFRNFAAVLRDTRDDASGFAVITDPKTQDAISLPGVTTAQVRANPKDFTFV